MTPAVFLLAAVTLERLGELWVAARNTNDLIAKGAFEVGRGHYPLIVAVHALWLVGLWTMVWGEPLHIGWFGVFVALQGLRFWTLATLGRRWTTRIVILPGAPLVANGPYYFVSHPNYLVVVGEIAVLPLCFGLPLYALVFSVANAAVLFVRIRAENAALDSMRGMRTP